LFHFPHYTHATGPFSSIIEDDWKLIRFYNNEKGTYQLYDLAADEQEQYDKADSHPDIRDRLAGHLDGLLREMDAEMPVLNPDYDPNNKAKRKNLKSSRDLAERERQIFKTRLRGEAGVDQ